MIEIRSRSGMEADCGTPLFLGNPTRFQIRHVIRIDSHSKLDRDRNVPCRVDRSPHDVAQQPGFQRNRGPTALPGDLPHRTSEIHIQVIDPAFPNESLNGLGYIIGIDTIDLQAAG